MRESNIAIFYAILSKLIITLAISPTNFGTQIANLYLLFHPGEKNHKKNEKYSYI
jgi:hypothetical protein